MLLTMIQVPETETLPECMSESEFDVAIVDSRLLMPVTLKDC